MSMKVAKRGTRASGVRITINKKMQAVHFSAGFFRQYKFGKENAKYVLTGYDRDLKEIGFQFLKSNENQKEALTLTYSQSGSSEACVFVLS